MSAPKLTRIVQALARRLEVVSQANGYYTEIGQNIRLDMRTPQQEDLPCVLVFASPRTTESTSGCRQKIEMAINVIGYVEAKDDGLILGGEIDADIMRAIEIDDLTFGGLLQQQYGLQFESGEIFMPEIGAGVVGARVTYSAPFVRITGDPEIA